jgi:predicted nuclease of restriction endonuclease-like (RecB) superfamily
MNKIILDKDYSIWLSQIKEKVRLSQIKASLSINKELISLYINLGVQILEKQEYAKWGENFLGQLSKDLRSEFPDISGFSKRNLELIRQWTTFYLPLLLQNTKQAVSQIHESNTQITKQLVSQLQIADNKSIDAMLNIPWGHHILIIQKIKNTDEALFYVAETIENNWSRSILEYQIETNLYKRQGAAISNFKNVLPLPQSDLANELLKDPYNFEFISLGEKAKEKELEQKLVQQISKFLLELGKGFAYMGQQFQLKVGNKEYRTDLLFYHTKLKCYVVIELKYKEFEPEFIGKLNFYISAIDQLVKDEADNATIGILLCKNKDNYEVEFALRDINKPIGVSEYRYKELPDTIKQAFPTLKQLTEELKSIETNEQ